MSYYVIDSIGQLPVSIAYVSPSSYNPQGNYPVPPPESLPLTGVFNSGEFWKENPAAPRPLYSEATMPLFRNDVLEAVLAAGVDNVKLYPCVLQDKNRPDIKYTNYTAVHVIGTMFCACKKKSAMMGIADEGDLIPDHFSKLHINALKADGVLMFHLGEASNALIVHEKVKRSILSRGIKHVHFYGPGEWAG